MQPKRRQKDRPRRSFFRPPPPPPAQRAISRPGASAFFVSDGPISSNSGRNGGKNAGRNCVSALPQRAIPGSDLLRILADIAFHHRCRSKGLRVRSPARRLPRPLAPATVDVFAPTAIPQSLPLEGKVPPKGADEVSPRSGVKLPRPRRSRGRAEIRDHGGITPPKPQKQGAKRSLLFYLITLAYLPK